MGQPVFIHITDTYAADLVGRTVFGYGDHAENCVLAYASWYIPESAASGKYSEVGIRGDCVSCIAAVGEEVLCLCLLNASTGEPVRQFVLPLVLITKAEISDGITATSVRIHAGGDVIELCIPAYAFGTSLKHQKGMRKRFAAALVKMKRRRQRAAEELR